jgi:hypothetical protein
VTTSTQNLTALHPVHLEDLRKSGLSDATITAARLYSVRPHDLARLCGRRVPEGTSGLAFPYGEGFERVKLFPAFREGVGREVKYLQPSGSPVRAYFPSGVQEILADQSRSLCITEGEKKALALAQAGFPTVGLGGIWNFRTKDLPNDTLIPDLEAITWAGRIVCLVPDSDAWSNEHVLHAVYRFARLLEARGATVLVVKLPAGPDGGKQGADDYLVAKGPEAFRCLQEKVVTLGYQAFKAFREQEKAKARRQKANQPVPPELAGRRIHPALHFDPDGFAAVGILGSGTWRTITSDRKEYPAEALMDILAPEPATYPALGERWASRLAFMNGEVQAPSWTEAVAMALAVFREYLELDSDPPYAVLGLWTLGTYCFPILPSYPRLNVHGEKGSGKSKTLKLVAALAHNGLWRTAPTPATLFRLIETLRPTLCLDELEHMDRDDRGDIQAILNAGYVAGGAVDRCDSVTFNVRPFAVYGPIAIAGIKGINAVLADRSITIVMQPGRDPSRINRPVDLTAPDPRFALFRDLAYRLTLTRWRDLRAIWERLELPVWLNGRSRELWSPLLALAELVVAEPPRVDLRPALLALARPDAEDRAELPEMAAAVLTAMEEKLSGADTLTIQPGELKEGVSKLIGYDVTPNTIGLRMKALGFGRDRGRKGGSWYPVTRDKIQAVRERRRLLEESPTRGRTT